MNVLGGQLARFEEFQIKPISDDAPNTSNGKGQAKRNSQPTQNPVEVPIEAVFGGLLYENPHEAWIRKSHRKSESSH